MSNIVESLSAIPVPKVSRRGVNRLLGARTASNLDYAQVKINLAKIALIRIALGHLTSGELHEEIDHGNIALAIVRPRAEESRLYGVKDDEATRLIMEKFRPELTVILAFPFVFNSSLVRNIWESKYIDVPPVKYSQFSNAYDEFEWVMTRGASTVLLAHSPDGNAVPTIRKKIGQWKDPEPGSIRDELALKEETGGIANNLVHSSDCPKKVKEELKIIVTELKKVLPN